MLICDCALLTYDLERSSGVISCVHEGSSAVMTGDGEMSLGVPTCGGEIFYGVTLPPKAERTSSAEAETPSSEVPTIRSPLKVNPLGGRVKLPAGVMSGQRTTEHKQ